MFSKFYELFLHPSNPQYDKVFMFVGLCLLVIPAVLCALYYLVINGFESFDRFRHITHWVITLLLSVVLLCGLSILISEKVTDSYSIDPDIITLSIVNSIFAGLIFLFYSLIFKGKSLHAKYVPFKYILGKNKKK